MSEISTAPEQDQIAESLLGEPQEQPTTDQTGAEQGVEGSEQLDTQVEAESQEQVGEIAEDWLPSEQQKVFPDDVLRQYAEQRYPDILRLLDNDPTNGVLRQLLHDKLNTDIYLRSQQEQEQGHEEQAEAETPLEPTQPQPQITREQWFQSLDRLVNERTDPEVAKAFHSDFLRAFGVPEAEIQKLPPQQAMQFTQTASKYMLNLVHTFLGDMLGAQLKQQVSQVFPGFEQMYERSAYAMKWDQVRNSNPRYAALPAYGTKEFSQVLREATDRFPELVGAFEGADGVIPVAQAQRAYSLLAKIATGQNVDPQQLLQKAASAGARSARRADVRRSAANLGSGQSKAASQRSGSRFQTNEDIFDDETMALYQKEHGRL